MAPRKQRIHLQLDSAYDKYDANHDGTLTDDEMSSAAQIAEIDNRYKKESQQRRMAWVALLAIVIVTAVLLTPMVDISKIAALADLLGMFYIALAGIVATFFGASAWISTVKR